MRYKKNLRIEGCKVYSYSTHVATIDREARKLYVHGYWSTTTSKHVNHVAAELGLEKVEKKDISAVERDAFAKAKDAEGMGALRTVAFIAMMGDVFHKGDAKASNDWKARMLRAGLEGRGLIMPEDWDSLTEDEKTRRLDGAIKNLA